ncbi:caspase domain-containing protein [Streptomyces sp. NPDC048243]|uniref:caspase family protein n=1 Tax=Streptomyces sp. NPDC048243 TaxID=3365522 RepID=UPI003714DDAF
MINVLPDPGASRAVLVGTSRYQYLEQLPAVSNNLKALAGLLRGPLSLHLPPEQVSVIENPPDTSMVMDAVRQAADGATDTLIVYFAGHGLVDGQDELGLALPHTQTGRIETVLPYDWLRRVLLEESRAERHVVILDCCYSGRALGRMSAASGLADQAEVEGSFLLAASAETRTALAPVGDTYTAFTGALLDTLTHGIPGGPALLDLAAVYWHLRRTLEARRHPVPQARNRNSGAQVALGRNRAELPAVPMTTAPDAPAAARPWPDPRSIRTVTGYFTSLAAVREVSGLTQQAVVQRSGGRISSTSTVGRLVNGHALPAAWPTTAAYLSACGLSDEEVLRWQDAWQRLRSELPPADPRGPAALPSGKDASVPKTERKRRPFSAFRRRGAH